MCLIWVPQASSQEPELVFEEDQLTESLQGAAAEDALDLTEWNRRKPIKLQTVTAQELFALGILLPEQIEAFLLYREAFGPILSVYELQVIEGFDLSAIQRLLPYLEAPDLSKPTPLRFSDVLHSGQHRISIRWGIRDRDRAEQERWAGSAHQFVVRHRYTYGTRVRWGFTAEKDAGEAVFGGVNPRGFDHYSAHLYVSKPLPFLHSLSIGDYSVRLGQGLLVWQGLGLGKGPATLAFKRNAEPLLAHSSGGEIGYFRGGALRWVSRNKRWDALVFASRRNRDGRPKEDEAGALSVPSLPETGLHRTSSEMEIKKQVLHKTLGFSAGYALQSLQLGLQGVMGWLNIPLIPAPAPYRHHYFRGSRLGGVSVDYRWNFRQFRFFGELARSTEGQNAQLHACLFSMGPRLDMGLLWRDYDAGYETLHAAAFAASTLPRNERGMYLAVEARPFKKLRVQAYYDVWKHPWLRFQVPKPSEFSNYLIRATYIPRRYWEYYAELRGGTAEGVATQIRLHASMRLNKSTEWRMRLNLGTLQGSTGYTLHQDILFRPAGKPWVFMGRLALIETPDFNLRFYNYENDLLYRFSMPAYYSRAMRSFIQLRYKGLRSWVLEFRWGGTLWNPTSRDAGWQHEYSAQMHYRF